MGTSWAEWKFKKKNCRFEVSSFLILCNNKPFWITFQYVMKSGFYMTTSNNQLIAGPRRSSKALPKVKLAPKKGHGHYLVVHCWSDVLQLFESQWNHYIWEVCSPSRWDVPQTAMPTAGIGQQKGTNSSLWQCLTTQPTIQNLNELGYKVLPHPSYSPDLLTTDLFCC